MSYSQLKQRISRVFKKVWATKRKSWYVEETVSSPPCEQQLPHYKTAQTAPVRGPSKVQPADFRHDSTPLISMTDKLSEWVELYDREHLNACIESCLKYEGLNLSGFHLFTLTPRPFLEMRNTENQPVYSLSWESCTALDHLLRYIPAVIASKANNAPFVLVIRDIYCMSGCSEMCVRLLKTICRKLINRFGDAFERVVIYRPAGLLARDLSHPQCLDLPYSSHELVVADENCPGRLAKATGFPNQLIPEDELECWCETLD